MARAIIAMIFPEYIDKGNSNITAYDWKQDEHLDKMDLKQFIENLHIFVDFFNDEECGLMYDAKNVESFIFSLDILQDCYPNVERKRLRSELQKLQNLENWRKTRVSSEKDEYELYYYGIKQPPIKDEIRTEITARMEINPKDDYVLAVYKHGYEKKWEIKKDCQKIQIEAKAMSIKEVFKWLSDHRHPTRKFELNKKKHGENGKGAQKSNKEDPVSQLPCSEEEAREMMHTAIGLPDFSTIYYCIDPKNGKYMIFRQHLRENSEIKNEKDDERTYHAYPSDEKEIIPKEKDDWKRIKRKLQLINNFFRQQN